MNNVSTLIREGRVDEAEAELEKRRTGDKDAEWHYQRGLLLEVKGELEEAIAAFEQAVESDGNHLAAMFRLACDLDLYGDEEAALELYERIREHSPSYVNALLNMATIYEDRGNYDEAYDCVERVLHEHPNHARAELFRKDIESSMTMQYDESQERTREKRDAILDIPVSDFELSVRSRNCLKKMNIHTLGDLLRTSEPDLMGYKNFGETSLSEIKAMLKQKGLRIGQLKEEAQQPSRPAATPRRPGNEGSPDLLSKYLSEIELSGRSRKCLQRLNLVTLADLVAKTESELLATKNFGQTSLHEVKAKLSELGLTLRKKAE
jgi:DNA-directed RNA polymerase subunit alpha